MNFREVLLPAKTAGSAQTHEFRLCPDTWVSFELFGVLYMYISGADVQLCMSGIANKWNEICIVLFTLSTTPLPISRHLGPSLGTYNLQQIIRSIRHAKFFTHNSSPIKVKDLCLMLYLIWFEICRSTCNCYGMLEILEHIIAGWWVR